MDNAEKIRDKIIENARAEAEEIIDHANSRAEKLLTNAKEEASQLREKLLRKAEEDAARLYRRAVSMAHLEMQKATLAMKQDVIAEVFNQAIEQLSLSDINDYRRLMLKVAINAVETGQESIILNPRDKKRLGQDFIDQLNSEVIKRQLPGQLMLAKDTAPISGGFILRRGGVENNYSFDALFRSHREELEPQVAQILFPAQVRSE